MHPRRGPPGGGSGAAPLLVRARPDVGPAEGFDIDFFLSYPQEQALGPKHVSQSCPACGYSVIKKNNLVMCLACNYANSTIAIDILPGDADRPPKSHRPADDTIDSLAYPTTEVTIQTSDSELPSDGDDPSARSDYYDRMRSGLQQSTAHLLRQSDIRMDNDLWPSEDSGAYVTQKKKDPYEIEASEEAEVKSYPEPEFNTQTMDDNLQPLGNAWSGYVIQDDANPGGFPGTDFLEESDFMDENSLVPGAGDTQPFGYAVSSMNGDSHMQRHIATTSIERVRELTKEFMEEYGKTNIVKRSVLAFLKSKGLPQYLSSDIVRCMKHDHKVVIPDVLDTFPLSEKADVNVRRLASAHEQLIDLSIENVTNSKVSSILRRCAANIAQAIAKMERNSSNKYELTMSDIKYGHPELGFIERHEGEDPDDEDMRYTRMLKNKGYKNINVRDGVVTVAKIS